MTHRVMCWINWSCFSHSMCDNVKSNWSCRVDGLSWMNYGIMDVTSFLFSLLHPSIVSMHIKQAHITMGKKAACGGIIIHDHAVTDLRQFFEGDFFPFTSTFNISIFQLRNFFPIIKFSLSSLYHIFSSEIFPKCKILHVFAYLAYPIIQLLLFDFIRLGCTTEVELLSHIITPIYIYAIYHRFIWCDIG